jgi:adenylate cyclase
MSETPLPTFDYGDSLARWFVTEAYTIADTGQLIREIGERLVQAGIPLYRLSYFQRLPHPELLGRGYFWRRGQGVIVQGASHRLLNEPEYLDNPLPVVFDQRKTVRVRLEAQSELRAPILRQLKDEGCTDYVAMPVHFSTGHIDALSVVSDRPGGFSAQHLARMYGLEFLFARIAEIHTLRDTAVNLLDAYVGRAAGKRILAGEVKRGDGQTIDAVIWYSDLRGFTRASDSLPRDTILGLLGDYFGAMAEALEAEEGEVLKFIGDAMLAMFPADAVGRAAAAGHALAAADRAAEAIGALNTARAQEQRPILRFGVALHVGEVMFGNIGARTRLDYTVIGPAVNHVARLETLCAALDRPLVVSADLARLLPQNRLIPLGAHALKDIPAPQPVFAVKDL